MGQLRSHRKLYAAGLILSGTLIIAGCGGGGGGSGPTASPPPGTGTGSTLTGTVFGAATSGATVTAYAVDAHGQQTGAALGTSTTNSSGVYTLPLSTTPAGPIVLVSSGGTYTSEADQTTQPGASFSALVPTVPAGSSTAQLNPLTSAISAQASNSLASSSSTPISTAIADATTTTEKLFGLTALTTNPLVLAPDPKATSGDAWRLSALAGALEQLRASSAIKSVDLYAALSEDISDGKLDGLKDGKAITIGSTASPLAASLFTTQLSGAANAYGAANSTYAGATAGISQAAQGSAQAAGIAIGSSGSIAPLETQAGGTQLYFAARTDGLVKLDMSDPTKPTAAKVTAINNAVLTATTAGGTPLFTSVDGIVINPTPITVNNSADVYGIIYSYGSSTIVSVDLTKGTVADTADLKLATQVDFSGASAYVAGGIADGQRGLIWLATSNGLLGVDPADLTKPAISIPQPAGTQINENIGGDPAADIVFSPDYNSQGMVVFNLAERKAYVMSQSDWSTLAGTFATDSYELDGVALDSQYKVALITPESTGSVGILGYSTPTGATGTTGTFASTLFKAFSVPSGFDPSGAAIDPISHTALFVGEGGDLGVGVMDNPANTNWKGFSSFVASTTSSYSFEPHDPHTVAAFNIGGKPYGFLLQGYSSPYQVVILDLNAILNAPASSGVLAGDPLTDTTMAKLLSY